MTGPRSRQGNFKEGFEPAPCRKSLSVGTLQNQLGKEEAKGKEREEGGFWHKCFFIFIFCWGVRTLSENYSFSQEGQGRSTAGSLLKLSTYVCIVNQSRSPCHF